MSDQASKAGPATGSWEQQRIELTTRYPFNTLNTIDRNVLVSTRANGDIILASGTQFGTIERSIVAYLRRQACETPEHIMLAERAEDGQWRRVSYLQMRQRADAIGQSLIDLGLAKGSSVLILSENSIEHAVIALGAMTVGVTVVPISPAYSLRDKTFGKVKHIWGLVEPALVFAQDATQYAEVISQLPMGEVPIVAVNNCPLRDGFLSFDELIDCRPTSAVEEAYESTDHDTVAKILFTSGSTGRPKGVINTQRMLCVNMAMQDAMWQPEENDIPYVTVNWMPWNHTMAGNGLFHRSLRQGGTYYIDHGKPLPGEYETTVASLREVSPHSHSDVPSGFSALADALEGDPLLNQHFFKNLRFLQYAGASLPESLWVRLQRLSVAATGKLTPFITGYGCTEAGPLITQLYWTVSGSGIIGLPAPGMEVKLIPVDADRFELRARGLNITSGYLKQPDVSSAAFDDEGFYKTQDSVTFVDKDAPEKGLRFGSRVSEDFKLLTGTFVAAGIVRSQVLIKLAPLVADVVLTGEDKPYLAVLAWPNVGACRAFLGVDGERCSNQEVIGHPSLRMALRTALREYNELNGSSSARIDRLLLMEEPPSPDDNEITEKGYVNQRGVIDRRKDLVSMLYGDEVGEGVVLAN